MLGGSVFEGFLAVLLAVPCSAPLWAQPSGLLTHGLLEIFLIFAALGLGLAAPFMLSP